MNRRSFFGMLIGGIAASLRPLTGKHVRRTGAISWEKVTQKFEWLMDHAQVCDVRVREARFVVNFKTAGGSGEASCPLADVLT